MFVRGSRAQDAPVAHWILYGHLIEFSTGAATADGRPPTSSAPEPPREAMVRDHLALGG